MATIAFGVFREARFEPTFEAMAVGAFEAWSVRGPLARIRGHVLPVREALQAKLSHSLRECDKLTLRVDRHLMTGNTKLARSRREVFVVTVSACRVTRELRRHVIVQALMAERAIQFLMFGSRVAERRIAFHHGSFDGSELGLRSSCGRRWRLGRSIGVVRDGFRTAAREEPGSQCQHYD
jgi:hypothetical protein